MSTRFGRIVDGEIEIATTMQYKEGRGVYHPTDDEYREMGYKRLVNYWDISADDYVDDGMAHELVSAVETTIDGEDVITCTYHVFDSKIGHREFSKLYLELALFKLGLLSTVDAFIDSQVITNDQGDEMPLRRAYDTALTFSEENQYFTQFKEALQAQLHMTDEQIEAILSQCEAKGQN